MTQEPAGLPVLRSIETLPSDRPEFRINPTLALFLALDDIALILNNVLSELQRRPQGYLAPLRGTANGTGMIREDLRPAWFSFVLTNDGPDPLEFAVNIANSPFSTIGPREVVPVDMKGTPINAIFLRSQPGQTASYRVYGVF